MKIKRFKLRDGVTKEELIALGFKFGGTWIKKDAELYLHKYFNKYQISIDITFTENINNWNDHDNVLVLDEEGGQPYYPFYDDKYYDKEVTNFPALEDTIQNYNEFISSLGIFEEVMKMKQYTKLFEHNYLGDDSVDVQLNDFLRKNPNYRVSKVDFNNEPKTTHEYLFVVFDVEDEIKD